MIKTKNMGKHIIILDRTKKESIDLGKILSDRTGFQMKSEKIVNFLADRLSTGNKIEISTDEGDLPEYEEQGWKEIDSF